MLPKRCSVAVFLCETNLDFVIKELKVMRQKKSLSALSEKGLFGLKFRILTYYPYHAQYETEKLYIYVLILQPLQAENDEPLPA